MDYYDTSSVLNYIINIQIQTLLLKIIEKKILNEAVVHTVIMSIGTSPNPLIKVTTDGLEVNSRGGIIVNEDGLTTRNAVYAGGDAVTGAATVISAMGAGKTAANAIDEYLKKKKR